MVIWWSKILKSLLPQACRHLSVVFSMNFTGPLFEEMLSNLIFPQCWESSSLKRSVGDAGKTSATRGEYSAPTGPKSLAPKTPNFWAMSEYKQTGGEKTNPRMGVSSFSPELRNCHSYLIPCRAKSWLPSRICGTSNIIDYIPFSVGLCEAI